MFMRSRVSLLAGIIVALMAIPAAAQGDSANEQRIPRIPLDWEADPNDSSVPVIRCVCGQPRIVALRGGKRIRFRVRQAR